MRRVNRHANWVHDKWPEPYRSVWKAAIEPGDTYKPGGPASKLAPRTRWNVERAFGRYQEFLLRTGRRDSTRLPDLDNLRAFGNHLGETLAPFSVIAILTQMTGALRAMFPKADLRFLNQVSSRLTAVAHVVRPIHERLLDPIALIHMGVEIMNEIEHREHHDGFESQHFRDAALINACAQMPLRLRNWQLMVAGKHLDLRTGRLKFEAAEMKRRTPFEATLPPAALLPLRIYWEKYRPQLMAEGAIDQGYLFPSANGGMSHRNSLGRSVKASIERNFGKTFNFHLFRHGAATFVSETAPEMTRILTGVLHHSRLQMANKHYICGAKRRAFKQFQGAVKAVIVRGQRRKAAARKSSTRAAPAQRRNVKRRTR